MGPLELYKSFVREHSALVVNLERLAHWVVWNPERFNERSEFAYEAFNAAVGLLGLYNESIISSDDGAGEQTDWGFLLAAVEQVQTLVELRGIQMEQRGKMSRYGPLIGLELLKLVMRLRVWSACRSHLALEGASREDRDLYNAEQRLKGLLGGLVRLRRMYDPGEGATPSGAGGEGSGWYGGGGGGGDGGVEGDGGKEAAAAHAYNARQAAAAAVRAAAIAPDRPPCACGSSGAAMAMGRGGAAAVVAATGLGAASGPLASHQAEGSSESSGDAGPTASTATAAAAATDATPKASQSEGPSAGGEGAGTSVSVDGALAAARGGPSVARVHRPFRWGWWGSSARSEGYDAEGAAARSSGRSGAHPGALPGSWAPPSRPPAQRPAAGRWPWDRRPVGAAGEASISTAGDGGGCRRLEEKLLERQAGWRLDPAGMDAGDRVIWLGELAYLLRPLIYVCLLKRHGLRSWRPWAASLGVELLSQYMLGTGHAMLQACGNKRWPPGSTLYSLALLRGLTARRWGPTEQQELLARRLGLLRYLLRSPCYDVVARPAVARAVRSTQWVPLLGTLGAYTLELVDSMQGYYTYVES